jgi:triosephosphate isomerase
MPGQNTKPKTMKNPTKVSVIINYKKLTGKDALDLTQKLNECDNILLSQYNIILAMQTVDALQLSNNRFDIFIQDIYSDEENCFLKQFSGKSDLKNDNIVGILLNHPEKPLSSEMIAEYISLANHLQLQIVLCATSIQEATRLNSFSPMYIGLENESLIGKNISLIDHCPEIVQQVTSTIDNDILIGAGIRTAEDLKHVVKFGGSGVLISSLVLSSPDPITSLIKFLTVS